MVDREGAHSLQFFVSYTTADLGWAEWIAWQLEAAGYRVVLQAWDFRPGENFVVNMRQALDSSDRTIAVISAAYLKSVYGSDEWTAAFIHDRPGETKVLPVRVEDVPLPRLLRPWIHIDLVGVDQQAAAQRLLDGVRPGRRKPEQPPAFPPTMGGGIRTPSFPGRETAISNLPPRSPTFTGRDTLLTELRGQLARAAPVAVVAHALYGLGGVGKTQLALEYAHRYAADYDLTWWIPAESPVTIADTLAQLAPKLGLGAVVDREWLVAAVLDHLRERDRWLLVFDNAEQPDDIAPFQPTGGHGHLLITSRNPAWAALGRTMRVDVLPHDEATGLLLHRTAEQDHASADQLATELGDLPLALEQAAAYLEQTGMPLAAYLALFRRHRQALLAKGRALAYHGQVDTSWHLSMNRLGRTSPAGAALLRLCAFLAPEAIPLDLITARVDRLPSALMAVVEDGEAGVHEAAGACYRYSLIDRDVTGIRVHRLVQQLIRAQLTKKDRQATINLAVELLDAALPQGAEISDPRRWSRFGQLISHVLAATRHAEEAGIAEATIATLLQRTAAYLWWVGGEYTAARDILDRALLLGKATLEPGHPTLGWILTDLGAVLRELGDPAGARAYLDEALETWRAAPTPNLAAEGSTLSYLGRALHDLDDLPRARAALTRAVTIQQAVLGPSDPAVGSAMGHLGEVLRHLGKLADAKTMQEQTIAVKTAALGPNHPSVGRSIWNLGKVLHDLGDLDAAQAAFEQAVGILEAALGPDHPHVGNTRWSLGDLLHEHGDLAGASVQLARAHAIFQSALGSEHPNTKAVASRLADTRGHNGSH